MSDDRAPAMERFIADLRRAWTLAGPPSFADLEKLSRHCRRPATTGPLRVVVLAASTTHEILTGQRRGLPKWQWVASFLTVLRIAAAEGGVNPDSLGTLGEWKARHEEADAELSAARGVAATAIRTAHASADRDTRVRFAPGPRPADLDLIDGDSEDARRASLLAMASRSKGPGWWHDYRDVVPAWFEVYLTLEQAASLIRVYETQFVPGLLQTEAYADAVIRIGHRDAGPAQVARRVEVRMRRQQILSRPNAPRLWAIIDEAALRRLPGSAAVMRAQLKHLIDVCEQPNVTVQVAPFSADGQAVAGGPIAVLRFPEREPPDVIYLEQLTTALYPHKQDDIQHYGQVMSRLGIEAARPDETAAILHRILKDLTT